MFARTFILAVVFLITITTSAFAGLTEGKRLAAIYDTILRAKFDDANNALRTACPPAPSEACLAMGVASLWWQILIDPDSRALDQRFEREARTSIAAADAWTRREPKRAEAWFYLAASYAPLTLWQALRNEGFAAARNGNRIRVALEKTITLDPTLVDAYFGIGMYHYWADVAPVAAKFLRMLLFLPGGDREKGLQEMLRARNEGVLLAGEADFQLHWLYLWFEHDIGRGLELVQGLAARYPTNPVFLQRIAEIEHDYRHDHRASATAWETLLARATRDEVERPRVAETRARIGIASEWLELSEPTRAMAALSPIADARLAAPYSAAAVVQLLLADAYERLHQRDRAVVAYNAAISLAPTDDVYDVRKRSREALRKMTRR